MIAFASSLDQGGVICASRPKTPRWCWARWRASIRATPPASTAGAGLRRPRSNAPLKGLRIGLLKEFFDKGLDAESRAAASARRWRCTRSSGATLREVSLPNLPLSVPTYYVVAPAECSSNLARFDGVRFGHRCKDPQRPAWTSTSARAAKASARK